MPRTRKHQEKNHVLEGSRFQRRINVSNVSSQKLRMALVGMAFEGWRFQHQCWHLFWCSAILHVKHPLTCDPLS